MKWIPIKYKEIPIGHIREYGPTCFWTKRKKYMHLTRGPNFKKRFETRSDAINHLIKSFIKKSENAPL